MPQFPSQLEYNVHVNVYLIDEISRLDITRIPQIEKKITNQK